MPPRKSILPDAAAVATSAAFDTLSQIGPIARSGVMDAVADRLRDEILSGRIASGATLPSERELSLALGVNRLTLRAALARLETLGLIVTRHGARTVVASWRERAGLEALVTLIGSKIEQENPAWRELLVSMLEVRRVLAAEAVALAAERHTEKDIEAMEQAALAQRTRTGDLIAFARGDVAFQRTIVRAANNVGLELMLNTFAKFPDEQPALVVALYERPEQSTDLYPLVIQLIRTRDGSNARSIVRGALDEYDRLWIQRHMPKLRTKKNASKVTPPNAKAMKKKKETIK